MRAMTAVRIDGHLIDVLFTEEQIARRVEAMAAEIAASAPERLLIVPILGWTGVSAYGARGALFGFNLPEIIAQNQGLGEAILQYHGWAAILLGLLVLMHIGAALMHRFILKDGVFARMWPGTGRKS